MKKMTAIAGAVSPLSPWIERHHPGFPYVDEERARVFLEYGGFIGIDAKFHVHESLLLPAQGLKQSWLQMRSYVDKALEIISDDNPRWLDSEEAMMIKEELGDPPPQCYQIYFISVGDGEDERLVYVGKTSSARGRFSGGHAAITKLHHPDYAGMQKSIYLGCITLLTELTEYLPLEFVSPLSMAMSILKSVEFQLIYQFKPPLNTQGKRRNYAKIGFQIHIQNFASEFLNDVFVYS